MTPNKAKSEKKGTVILPMKMYSDNYLKYKLERWGLYKRGMDKREMFKLYRDKVENDVKIELDNKKQKL